MIQHIVLRVFSKALIPFIMLFGLYVQFHGDFGPGGGFQAGVIFAAAIVLYALIFGVDRAKRVISPKMTERLIALGVLLYGGVGVVTMMKGENFLDYDALSPAHPSHGQHYGILLIELGVGITVTSVMIALFYCYASRGRRLDD